MELPIYEPRIEKGDIYFHHPGQPVDLQYNHDVDIVKFKGRYFASWNANVAVGEDVPGQFNFLSVSDDFRSWSAPIRPFTAEAGCENATEDDNQWQPIFINWKDEKLFCNWCTFTGRKVYVSESADGIHWKNVEVQNAPNALLGKACGFPTNHGIISSRGVMMFPCSVPFTNTERCIVGNTLYSGILMSDDGGKSWYWSDPIEAMSWKDIGEDTAKFGETVSLWEPSIYEMPDGTFGLLVRNSTSQDAPEKADKPHRMLLTATSADHGKTWTKARPVELDTICSRNVTLSGGTSRDSLFMVMNDWHVNIPKRISFDRYFLSLFAAPVNDPDLMLPGPVVQPAGACAFYPNAFVEKGKMHIAYTYPKNILWSVVHELPDFSKPFLMPRAGRTAVEREDGYFRFRQRETTLSLVLTKKLTEAEQIRLSFDSMINRYDGEPFPILTLGGKTRNGMVLRARYDADRKSDVLEVKTGDDVWGYVASVKMKTWNRISIKITKNDLGISVNGESEKRFGTALLRKIAFGGLYETPVWPIGTGWGCDVLLRRGSVAIA